jgi:integrase
MGSVYKRGKTYWIKYYKDGKPFYESAKTDKKMVAKEVLSQRESDVSQGKVPGVHFDKVKFEELAKDLLTDYQINQKKSMDRAELSIKHLAVLFKAARVTDINTARIKSYMAKRMEEGAANGTINRELSALKRMLMLGARCTPPKVDRVPYIPMLKENNIRKGFFEHEQFLAVREALPEHLKGMVTFAYKTGWRKSEIGTLQWSQVDLKQGIVRLNPGETKNDQGRTVYLDQELMEVFRKQREVRVQSGEVASYVFLNSDRSDRVKFFGNSWKTACKVAGVDPRLFHDFRRTAVRNMVRAGIPERVAMMISGHKTRAVFERYNIVSDGDLRLAASRQEAFLNDQEGGMVTKTVTIGDFGNKKRSQA